METTKNIVEAVPLVRGDSNVPVPYCAIVNDASEVIGVARDGHYLLHGNARKLMGYAVTDAGLSAEYRIVGTWNQGKDALIEATFDRPESAVYGVRPQYWIFNDCVSGDIFVWVGVLADHAVMGTTVSQSVFVLCPSPVIKIKGEHYASQFNVVARDVQRRWDEQVLPWVANLSASYCDTKNLIQQIRDKTNVSKKYLDVAESDFETAQGQSCWQYTVTLSATIDQMTTTLFRRFDLRHRANKPVASLLASLDAENQGGTD